MVKVKICGVTSPADARMCAEQGADFVGNIVDIPSSPRSVSPHLSKELVETLPPEVKGIAVMAPRSLDDLIEAAELIKPCCIQLHGSETLEFVREAKKELSCGVIKALHIKDEDSISEALAYSEFCDGILLDTPSKAMGGSGIKHDWEISLRIVKQALCHVFLAGGLNPENVSTAREFVAPFCLDVSSGVESRPGVKDPKKVEAFIERAKHPS